MRFLYLRKLLYYYPFAIKTIFQQFQKVPVLGFQGNLVNES